MFLSFHLRLLVCCGELTRVALMRSNVAVSPPPGPLELSIGTDTAAANDLRQFGGSGQSSSCVLNSKGNSCKGTAAQEDYPSGGYRNRQIHRAENSSQSRPDRQAAKR